MQRAWIAIAVSLAATLSVTSAQAALKVGDAAPDFTAEAAIGGKPYMFHLSKALAQGPVVLYFYPKAFTSGCTVEAHAFAEATPRFQALGATVIGMSSDDIDTLKRFSVEACRNQFAVAADAESKVIRSYDATASFARNMATRVSYVIDRRGRIVYVHESLSPEGHITETLKAVEALKR